ncbi:hypothetical protein QYF61_010939 [Mycteria americana]|uniref:Uncharacterized protein n=1 Tax=Mycteria americana TaxID=33587 RepID=A0AAN7PS70_MYCAM|nr:hypothetical protein QYF61_010939 [Mycteria americana]
MSRANVLGHKKLGGGTARTVTPTAQRAIPYHMRSCSAYKLGELAGERRSLLRDRLRISQRVLLRVKQLFKDTAATPTLATGTAVTPTPVTGTAATQTPVTGTVATPTPVTSTAAIQTPETGTAAEPANQPVLVSVAPIHNKKSWKQKSARLVRGEEASPKREQDEEAYFLASKEADCSKAGPSQEKEEEEEEFPASAQGRTQQKRSSSSSEGEEELINEMVTTQSLSLSELRDMQKDFSRHPGEHVVTWLLRCWDNGASSLELEGKEAKQLGSLSREGGIDKAIGKGEPAHSLWSWVEERDNQVYWTVWIRWPGTSDPQEYKALVDTSAQCTLMPSSYTGAEPICISGVTGGSQQLTVLEAEVSLTGNEWQKHPMVTGPEAPCILGIDYLRRGYFKDPKGYRWAFGIAALETEEIKQLSTLPGLSEDPSVVALLRVKEQQVLITTMVHWWQYGTDRDS